MPVTLTDKFTPTSPAIELPVLGVVKHSVIVYAPDKGVLVEQVAVGATVEVGVGAGGRVGVGVGELIGVEVAVGVGLGVEVGFGVGFPRE